MNVVHLPEYRESKTDSSVLLPVMFKNINPILKAKKLVGPGTIYKDLIEFTKQAFVMLQFFHSEIDKGCVLVLVSADRKTHRPVILTVEAEKERDLKRAAKKKKSLKSI